jgi:curved DNA-binding protein CbpA
MFKDYYKILEVDPKSSQSEIKTAFKKLALKWHPDRNPNMDTTRKMQDLNEAYLILRDKEARERYDREYQNYYGTYEFAEQENLKSDKSDFFTEERDTEKTKYEFRDEELYRWTKNAERQAVELAQRTIEDLKGMVKVGAKGALEGVVWQIVGVIIVIVIFSFINTCNS